ncbi:MAG: type II secretion system F family protein [Nanoarchaeota archaeon]
MEIFDIKKVHVIGIIAAVLVLVVSFSAWKWFSLKQEIFYFIVGVAVIISVLPFVFSLILESSREKENNEMFLEFSRNLAESVKAGTPISRSIMNLREKYYGSLTPHIKKLANQISLGIPVKKALEIFARDVDSRVISRAVTLIGEAEKAGGEIEGILESVAGSVNEIEKLKKERMSAIYSLVVQGYIIFFVFIVIMLIMQFKILPMTSEISAGAGEIKELGGAGESYEMEELTKPILYLLVVQGLFTGLVIGKLAEGSLKAGVKHSFAMSALSLLIYTGAKMFF